MCVVSQSKSMNKILHSSWWRNGRASAAEIKKNTKTLFIFITFEENKRYSYSIFQVVWTCGTDHKENINHVEVKPCETYAAEQRFNI